LSILSDPEFIFDLNYKVFDIAFESSNANIKHDIFCMIAVLSPCDCEKTTFTDEEIHDELSRNPVSLIEGSTLTVYDIKIGDTV
jgi:hypothetical protein